MAGTQADIAEDKAFQTAVWKVQRIGWLVMLAGLCLAGLGLTGGGGVFATMGKSTASGVVTAPRVARSGANIEWTIDLTAPGTQAIVTLDNAFLDAFDLQRVQPRPQVERATLGGLELTFQLGQQGSRQLRLLVKPRGAGWVQPGLRVGRHSVTLSTLVLP